MTQNTFTFLASWAVILALLTLASRTRVGYVAIYYGLLLLILILLVTEYAQIAPLLSGVESLSQLNAKAST